MRYLLIFSILLFSLIGCAGYDDGAILAGIEKKYPGALIIQAPGSKYRFFVKTETELRYLEAMNITNTDITLDYKISDIKCR